MKLVRWHSHNQGRYFVIFWQYNIHGQQEKGTDCLKPTALEELLTGILGISSSPLLYCSSRVIPSAFASLWAIDITNVVALQSVGRSNGQKGIVGNKQFFVLFEQLQGNSLLISFFYILELSVIINTVTLVSRHYVYVYVTVDLFILQTSTLVLAHMGLSGS